MMITRRLSMALLVAVAGIFLGIAAPASANDKAAVLAANARFYAALNKVFTGDVAAIKAIWSHADDVTYMGPTGNFEHGWSAVLKEWEGQAKLKLGGRVEPADIRIVVEPSLAVVSNYEVGENTNAKGKVAQVKLRATNIFRKENGEWKMVGHHTDLLPYLSK